MPSELLNRQRPTARPIVAEPPARPHLRLATPLESEPAPTPATGLAQLPGLAPATPRHADLLAGLSLVTGSAPSVRAEVLSRFTVTSHRCGEPIPALPRDCAYAVVLSGGISSLRESHDGTKRLVRLSLPGEAFTAGRATDGSGDSITHTALDDTRIAMLSAADVEILAMQSPSFGLCLWRETAAELDRAQQATIDLAFLDVPARIAKLLLGLESRYGMNFRGTTRVEHTLSQTDIANIVCASRETVNKTLNDFSRRGWILLEGKSYIVQDRSRLAQRAR